MSNLNRGLFWAGIAAVTAVACNARRPERPAGAVDGGAAPFAPASAPDGGSGHAEEAPPRTSTHAACVLSADCPDGAHCDLGQCVQECNADSACAEGLSCSARARCLTPGAADVDPPPVTKRAGTIQIDPPSAELTDRDDKLALHLTSDSPGIVRYRVELNAPYLSIDSDRGEFTGDAILSLHVDSSRLEGQDLAGSIRIFTTLGNVEVSAPIHVGVSGTYQGTLTYDGTAVPLGSTELVLDVSETNGDVLARVDPGPLATVSEHRERSRHRPRIYTLGDGVHLTLGQVVPADFGGPANLFARSIGRSLSLALEPSDRGTLAGTFTETVYGIFAQAVTLTGTVYLERRPLEPAPNFAVPDALAMPVVDPTSMPDVATVFPSWTATSCDANAHATLRACSDAIDCANAVDEAYHGPLAATLAGALPETSDPIGDLARNCETELAATNPLVGVTCAQIVPLACALRDVEESGSNSDRERDAFGTLYAHTLDPALFVAQNDIVDAVKQSFVTGTTGENGLLTRARRALQPAAEWALHPKFLEYFRRIPAPSTPEDTAPPSYTAARTLARLFYVLSTIDGEISRNAAGDRLTTRDARVESAQEHGVLTLFQAATIIGIVNSWNQAPASLGTEFTDVLTPIDEGFQSLLQGALIFGVRDGLIPFVYQPGKSETNFQQFMDTLKPVMDQAFADETAFSNATRDFEQSEEQLSQELEAIRSGYDESIRATCGSAFDLDTADFTTCGANDSGQVGSLQTGIAVANQRLLADQDRIKGMRDKIQIEQDRINQVHDVRLGTISFTEGTGEQLQALVWAEGVIDAVEKMIEVSAEASLWNAGAPVAEGAAEAVVELQRTTLESKRQSLQTAQDVRVQADNAEVEVINGMATIKSLMVDMAQLEVEMQEDVLGQVQAEIDVKNAVAGAKRVASDRTKVLDRITHDPLRDPAFRVLQSRSALQAILSRGEAGRQLYLAGRALEYELNQPLGDDLSEAVLGVFDSAEANRLQNCLSDIFNTSLSSVGATQDYSTEFSLRKQLGITGLRTDDVTGEQLTPGDQFRRLLLRNENLDGQGGVGLKFSSNLESGNGLWPSDVCDDRIDTVEAQIVGDFLGDNQATVELALGGGGVLRRCDTDELVNWSTSGNASIQAGVNTYGTAPTPNGSLHGLSVASATWKLTIPGPSSAPSNADLDLTRIEDVVIRVKHKARPIRAAATPLAVTCLSTVGAGL